MRAGHPLLASLLTVSLASLPTVQTVVAETPEDVRDGVAEELQLLKEETVSIAVRHEQPISQAPANVYVITDEDIRQSGAIDLPTILRRIPGMEVMQVTGAEFNVSVRGDNQLVANKLLVMVDGRSIYVDADAQVFWKAIPVTLPEIKRIEVLKGPASYLYGFNAFDGIVNIITKSAEEMKGTTLQFGGGEFGTISSAGIQAGIIGKLGYRLSVGEDQTQQWRNRDALAFRAYKVNGQTEYALSGLSKLVVSGGVIDMNRYDGQVADVLFNSFTLLQSYANVAYERQNFFVRGWWTGNYSNPTFSNFTNPLLAPFLQFTNRNGNVTQTNYLNTYNFEAQQMQEFWNRLRFTYGLNYRYNTISAVFVDGLRHENRLGFYLQGEWHATSAWEVVAGVRYDLDTFIHPTISPRVALFYRPAPDHTFRLTASVAYRPPTLIDTFLDDLTTVTGVPTPTPVLGSTGLSPEQIISYEAEYQGWYFRHRLRARGSLFYNHISDIIQLRTNPSGIATPLNQGEADIYGGEAGVEYLATRWLSGFANYAYEEIHQTLMGTAQRGAPHSKVNAGLRAEFENGVSGEAVFHYVGAATYPVADLFTVFAPLGGFTPPNPRVGSYNLLNLRGAYRFWHQKAAAGYMREAEVAVSAFNALNDQHKEHPLGDTISSRVMGWLTLRF